MFIATQNNGGKHTSQEIWVLPVGWRILHIRAWLATPAVGYSYIEIVRQRNVTTLIAPIINAGPRGSWHYRSYGRRMPLRF